MAVLLIATDRADSIPADTTPLGASLDAAATIVRWTFDADDPAVTATVMIDVDTALRPGALDLIGETLDHHLDVEILTADGLVDDELRLRGAWAPTRIAHDPSELDLVVTRGHAADGSLDARVEALFAVDPASIGQLPAVLTEHSGPPPLGLATMERAADLLARRRTRPTVGAVSVVIPTAGFLSPDGRPLVVAAIDAARRGGITDLEILLVVGDEYVGDPESLLADDVRLVHRPPGSWNFSAAVNLGLLAAEHDHVLVLNDDIEAIGDGWLASMAAHLRDPDVGAVGALLLFPDGTIQHAGMVVDPGSLSDDQHAALHAIAPAAKVAMQ
ncbi:MAG: glycosyltransferase, partial [Actinomycetota bacterium]